MEEQEFELLKLSGELSVPKFKAFKPSDRFTIGGADKETLSIYRLGNKFQEKFINGNDCVEGHGVDVGIYTMKKVSRQSPQQYSIVSEIEAIVGANMSIGLGHLWWILRGDNTTDNYRKCFNLIKRDSHANIFFVRDEEGVGQMVHAYFMRDGWVLSLPKSSPSNGLPDLDDWAMGRRVIARNNSS